MLSPCFCLPVRGFAASVSWIDGIHCDISVVVELVVLEVSFSCFRLLWCYYSGMPRRFWGLRYSWGISFDFDPSFDLFSCTKSTETILWPCTDRDAADSRHQFGERDPWCISKRIFDHHTAISARSWRCIVTCGSARIVVNPDLRFVITKSLLSKSETTGIAAAPVSDVQLAMYRLAIDINTETTLPVPSESVHFRFRRVFINLKHWWAVLYLQIGGVFARRFWIKLTKFKLLTVVQWCCSGRRLQTKQTVNDLILWSAVSGYVLVMPSQRVHSVVFNAWSDLLSHVHRIEVRCYFAKSRKDRLTLLLHQPVYADILSLKCNETVTIMISCPRWSYVFPISTHGNSLPLAVISMTVLLPFPLCSTQLCYRLPSWFHVQSCCHFCRRSTWAITSTELCPRKHPKYDLARCSKHEPYVHPSTGSMIAHSCIHKAYRCFSSKSFDICYHNHCGAV